MRRILEYLWKNNSFLLFVVLEFFAFLLLINHNQFQRSSFFSSSNRVTARINKTINGISDYFSLRYVNEKLAEENAMLRSLNQHSFRKVESIFFIKDDTVYRQRFQYASAKVISNSIKKRNNYLTIDIGSKQGSVREAAVICDDGVVGFVKSVSDNFSSVISVLHKDTKISAKIKKNGYIGSLIWDGKDYQHGILMDIPLHVELSVGDTVVTSGYSSIFPENILIGTISKFKINEGDSFYSIQLKFSVDYNKVSYVYVVRNLLQYEQKALELSTQNE